MEIRRGRKMYKLQLQLVPPSSLSTTVQGSTNQYPFNNSQLMSNMSGISLNNLQANHMNRGGASLLYPALRKTFSMSSVPRSDHNIKRILHFTKNTNNLQQLCYEIIEKIGKMYPDLKTDIEIETLQDNNGCDLDPDFIIKDVFTTNNIVQVLLKNDIDWNEHVPVSGYSSKKRRLDQARQNQTKTIQNVPTIVTSGTSNIRVQSESNGNTLPKKRTNISIKGSFYKGIRVSTPLLHQIHPSTSTNSDENLADPRDKSFLPPPVQPQSPPIRISSGIENGKMIRSLVEGDTVSRSETVDPNKSKQQRLQFDSPHIPITTPNRVNITGQNVNNNNNDLSYTQNQVSSVRRHKSLVTPRVTSKTLNTIDRNEDEIQSGSTPMPNVNTNTNRLSVTAVKNLYSQQASAIKSSTSPNVNIDDIMSSQYENKNDGKKSPPRTLKRQQSSIADNNGSPVKNSPINEEEVDQVHLAALPEHKIEQQASSRNDITAEPLNNINNSSESSDTDSAMEEEEQMNTELKDKISDNVEKLNDDNVETTKSLEETDSSIDKIDISKEEDNFKEIDKLEKSIENSSFQKSDLLDVMHKENFPLPLWLRESSIKPLSKHSLPRRKPYTTVLNKDIDNSKPDPRNILPARTPRNAAKKAAQKLSGAPTLDSGSNSDQHNSENSSSNEDSGPHSGVETDYSSDENPQFKNLSITDHADEVQVEIEPIKERIVTDLNTQRDETIESQEYHDASLGVRKSETKQVTENHKNSADNLIPESQADMSTNDGHEITNFLNDSFSFSKNETQGTERSSNKSILHDFEKMDTLPQSTQRPKYHDETKTPNKIPVSMLLELSAGSENKNGEANTNKDISVSPSILHRYNQKIRPSLNTIVDVKERNVTPTIDGNTLETSSKEDSISDYSSDSSSEEVSSSSDDDNNSSIFVNAKKVNSILRK